MTWPGRVIVDVVFIPIYVVLLAASLFNVLKHGHGKAAGFVFLAVFSIVRLVGNILLYVAYSQSYTDPDVAEWGYILQSLGYNFLLYSTLSFYQRGKDPKASLVSSSGRGIGALQGNLNAATGLHLVTVIALILLVTGYSDSNGIFLSAGTNGASASLDVKAKIGNCILVAVTIVVAVLTATSHRSAQNSEAKTIFLLILVALVPMSVRVIYTTYQSFTTHPFIRLLWEKVLFDYVMEVIVVVIYFVLGFLVSRISTGEDLESHAGDNPSSGASKSQRQTQPRKAAPVLKMIPIVRHFV